MDELTELGRARIDELILESMSFAEEGDASKRAAIAKRARRAVVMATHPVSGQVPQEVIDKALSAELAEAIRKLPHAAPRGNK